MARPAAEQPRPPSSGGGTRHSSRASAPNRWVHAWPVGRGPTRQVDEDRRGGVGPRIVKRRRRHEAQPLCQPGAGRWWPVDFEVDHLPSRLRQNGKGGGAPSGSNPNAGRPPGSGTSGGSVCRARGLLSLTVQTVAEDGAPALADLDAPRRSSSCRACRRGCRRFRTRPPAGSGTRMTRAGCAPSPHRPRAARTPRRSRPSAPRSPSRSSVSLRNGLHHTAGRQCRPRDRPSGQPPSMGRASNRVSTRSHPRGADLRARGASRQQGAARGRADRAADAWILARAAATPPTTAGNRRFSSHTTSADRTLVEQGHLAERDARPKVARRRLRSRSSSSARSTDLAVDQEEQVIGRVALAEDGAAGCNDVHGDRQLDRRQFDGVEPFEQVEVGERRRRAAGPDPVDPEQLVLAPFDRDVRVGKGRHRRRELRTDERVARHVHRDDRSTRGVERLGQPVDHRDRGSSTCAT